MGAFVERFHRAQCFDCGWNGPERQYRDDAAADAREHDVASHGAEKGGGQ